MTPDPAGFADGPNMYLYSQADPVNNWDPTGLWTEEGVINAFEKMYGDDEKTMVAFFTVMSFFKLKQGDFYSHDHAPPDFENGTISIARNAYFGGSKNYWGLGGERSDENAAEQLYENIWMYFRRVAPTKENE